MVAFGDELGLPRLLARLPRGVVVAVARAEPRTTAVAELEALAERHGVPVLVHPRPADVRTAGFVGEVRELAPDLILVDSYSLRLAPELLAAARHGGVNVHGALLPRHRGANPVQWALIDDDRETGVTIHRMSEGFDEGEVLAQGRVPIHFTDTWVDVRDRIGEATEALLARELPRLLAGDLRGEPQDEARATHRPRRTPDDGRIDWTAPALEIYNLIRALVAPHPGAFYEHDGRRLVLDRFVPVGEVVAMKFGPQGRQPSPAGPVRADGETLVIGDAALVDVDWEARHGRIVGGDERVTELVRVELGLDVSVDASPTRRG